MGLVKEFREFAIKGNVMDMAVGFVIGAAFGKIVASLVGDVIMPAAGALLGGIDFTTLHLTVRDATATAPAVTLKYGMFIQTIIDFLIIAGSIFLVIKAMNTLKRKEEVAPTTPPKPSNQEVLLTEIRDLMKQRTEAWK